MYARNGQAATANRSRAALGKLTCGSFFAGARGTASCSPSVELAVTPPPAEMTAAVPNLFANSRREIASLTRSPIIRNAPMVHPSCGLPSVQLFGEIISTRETFLRVFVGTGFVYLEFRRAPLAVNLNGDFSVECPASGCKLFCHELFCDGSANRRLHRFDVGNFQDLLWRARLCNFNHGAA